MRIGRTVRKHGTVKLMTASVLASQDLKEMLLGIGGRKSKCVILARIILDKPTPTTNRIQFLFKPFRESMQVIKENIKPMMNPHGNPINIAIGNSANM